jgi:hypothetical protein
VERSETNKRVCELRSHKESVGFVEVLKGQAGANTMSAAQHQRITKIELPDINLANVVKNFTHIPALA